MSQINFKKLFGILFSVFIVITVALFLLVSISQEASIAITIILVLIPLAVRYVVYKFAHIYIKKAPLSPILTELLPDSDGSAEF